MTLWFYIMESHHTMVSDREGVIVQAKREAEEQRLCAELEDLHNGSSSPMRDH